MNCHINLIGRIVQCLEGCLQKNVGIYKYLQQNSRTLLRLDLVTTTEILEAQNNDLLVNQCDHCAQAYGAHFESSLHLYP